LQPLREGGTKKNDVETREFSGSGAHRDLKNAGRGEATINHKPEETALDKIQRGKKMGTRTPRKNNRLY